MGLNSAEKERLEQLDDISLVEHLLALQQQCVDLFNKREMNHNDHEKWLFYHEQYYEKTSELIDVKYMVCGRMRYKSLYEDLKQATFGSK